MEKNPKIIPCAVCGADMASSAKVCPHCGAKIKKPLYKKWWFWFLIVVVILALSGSNSDSKDTKSESVAAVSAPVSTPEPIEYMVCDIEEMLSEIHENAMRAEQTYKGQYIEITGSISVIDSAGKYISLTDGDPFSIIGVRCDLKNDEQRQKIMDLSKGDSVTLRGKCTDVGEILGYVVRVDSVD